MSFIKYYDDLIELLDYVSLTELIDKYDLDVTKPDEIGDYPLHPICKALKPEWAAVLLDAGADVNVGNSYGYTPMLLTIEYCHFDPEKAVAILQLLLNAGADIEKRGDWDKTPFLKSCTRGQIRVTDFLVRQGCDIYAKADELGGPMGALEFCDLPGISREYRHYIKTLFE